MIFGVSSDSIMFLTRRLLSLFQGSGGSGSERGYIVSTVNTGRRYFLNRSNIDGKGGEIVKGSVKSRKSKNRKRGERKERGGVESD